jgi:AraC-like DNA-binding protein
MTGTQGIAPDGTRILLCGLSWKQIINETGEGVTMKDAAERLGVAYDHFRRKMHRLNMAHWWPRTQHGRARRLTKREAARLAAEGCSMKGAAKVTGLSYMRFQHLAKEYGLHNSFHPN